MKRWLELLTAVAAVLATSGVLIGGVRWAVDPLREDVQALRAEVRADIGELREDVADVRERLVRVEEAVKRLEAVQEARRRGVDARPAPGAGSAAG